MFLKSAHLKNKNLTTSNHEITNKYIKYAKGQSNYTLYWRNLVEIKIRIPRPKKYKSVIPHLSFLSSQGMSIFTLPYF